MAPLPPLHIATCDIIVSAGVVDMTLDAVPFCSRRAAAASKARDAAASHYSASKLSAYWPPDVSSGAAKRF